MPRNLIYLHLSFAVKYHSLFFMLHSGLDVTASELAAPVTQSC